MTLVTTQNKRTSEAAVAKRTSVHSDPITILDLMDADQLLGSWFEGKSWNAWRSFLKAMFGLEMTAAELATFQACTGRTVAKGPYREAWLAVGRRGGKSRILALIGIYLACFRDWSPRLSKGETGTILIVASARDQARTIMDYIREMLRIPILRPMVKRELSDCFELRGNNNSRLRIEVGTASMTSLRGYTLIAMLADEIAFWQVEG